MISSNAFNYINVLEASADAAWKREEVLTNNIANVSTPGFKRQDVNFENLLSAQLNKSKTTNLRDAVSNVDLNKVGSRVYTDMAQLSYRLDGNNVDVDVENVELASTQIKYNALIDSITHEFSMLKMAMNNN